MEVYTKEALEDLGIYELRSVARQVGVYSPSILKKEDLIKKILLVLTGKEEPYVKKNKQGRPAKNIFSINEMLNIFMPNNNNNVSYKIENRLNNQIDAKLMQDIEKLPEGKQHFSGWFKPQETGFGIIYKLGYCSPNLSDNYFVTQKLIKLFNLKLGDYVEGLCSVIGEDKPLIVTNIKTINSNYVEVAVDRPNFETLPAIYAEKQIKFFSSNKIDFKIMDRLSPMGLGSRTNILFNKNFDPTEYIIELLNLLSLNNNLKTLVLTNELRPEDFVEIKSRAHQAEYIDFNNKTYEQLFELFEVKINNAVRTIENGDNYVLFLLNTDKLLTFFKNYYLIKANCTEQQADVFAVTKLKEILLLAKNTDKNISLTIVSINCTDASLLDLFNNSINFNSVPIENTDIFLNIEKSYTLKANKILSAPQFNALQKFKAKTDKTDVLKELEKLMSIK